MKHDEENSAEDERCLPLVVHFLAPKFLHFGLKLMVLLKQETRSNGDGAPEASGSGEFGLCYIDSKKRRVTLVRR